MPLLSTTRKAAALSPPLAIDNPALSEAGVVFRKGQFSLVPAAPGVGKSLFANNLAIACPEPTLFFSADSDEWTVRSRTCAILSGADLDDIEDQMGDPGWEDYYTSRMHEADHIDWCYRTDIDLEFVMLRLQAHIELRGIEPGLVIVDNIGNMVEDNDNEYAELRTICRELQIVARTVGCHVMALHHVVGQKEDGDKPIGLGDVLGKVSKIPEMVLGLSRGEYSDLAINIAKNRGGKRGAFALPINYETATVGGFRRPALRVAA